MTLVIRTLRRGVPCRGPRCFGTASGSSLLKGGKYQGLTFAECREQHPAYCSWLLSKQQREGTDAQIFAAWLQSVGVGNEPLVLQKPESAPAAATPVELPVVADSAGSEGSHGAAQVAGGHMQVAFGKHAGSTFQQVRDADEDYCQWVLRKSTTADASSSLLAFASYLQSCGMIPTAPTQKATEHGADRRHQNPKHKPLAKVQDPGGKRREKVGHDIRNTIVAGAADDLPATQAPQNGDISEVVTFGKYQGYSFEQVRTEDPRYCSWVLQAGEQQDADPGFKVFATFLKQRASSSASARSPGPSSHAASKPAQPSLSSDTAAKIAQPSQSSHTAADGPSLASGEWTIAFGKYRGRTFREVYEQDERYCRWLVDETLKSPQANNANSAALCLYVLHQYKFRQSGAAE